MKCNREDCLCKDCEKDFGTDRAECDTCKLCTQQEWEEIGYCKKYREKEKLAKEGIQESLL